MPPDLSIISDFRPDPAKPGCVVVRVRGQKPWRLDQDAATALRLAAGREIDEALLKRLEQAAANCKARLRLQSRLAVRALSRIEAQSLMRRAGAEQAYAAATVKDFEQRGWIDDARLAANVASNEAARPVGKMRVVARVARRGINSGEARRAADEAVAARTQSAAELAEIAARSQLRKLPPRLERDALKRRLLGFLARRGFDEYTARQAIDAVLR